MTNDELDIALEELETRLERLRSLYEQYFMGIEKIEPGIVRKDVDRRIYILRREQIRNTAKRFKLQTIIQRYNTFAQYWQRICREIENGTYKRHVLRAERTFGAMDLVTGAQKDKGREATLGSSSARAAAEADLADLMASGADPAEEARRALAALTSTARDARGGATSASGGATTPSAPATTQRTAKSLDSFDLDMDFFDEAPTVPAARAPAPSSHPRTPAPSAKPSTASPSPPAAKSGPAPSSVGVPSSLATTARVPSAAAPSSATPSAVRPPAPSTVARPPAPSATPSAARPPVPSSVARPPAPSAGVQRPAVASDLAATARSAGVPPPAARPAAPAAAEASAPRQPPPTPQAARPAAKDDGWSALKGPPAARPAASAPGVAKAGADALSDARVKELHQRLVDARRQTQEASKVSVENLAKSLRDAESRLQKQHAGRKIDFDVVIKDGKAVVKPVVR